VIAADGRTIWVKDSMTVVYEGSTPVKMRGIIMDITERKKGDQEMIQARESALRAAQVKSDFLANMSHEIRTPLNAILGMATLALDTRLNKAQKDYLQTVKRSADTLLGLINDILDFSKIEAGKLNLEVLAFDLESLISDAVGFIAPGAKAKKLKIDSEIESDVPPRLMGDPGRLLQVLANLLANAVKFTEAGKISVRVRRTSDGTGQSLVAFEVADTGIGIPPEIRKQLFNPFYQGDASTARRYGGTGLGLSICKRLVSLMKGTITVESEPKKGSRFIFTIPCQEAEASAKSKPSETAVSRPARKRSTTSLKILVAEDNAANQKVLLRFLEKMGHLADAVANGQEALSALDLRPYDLVLMDCQMPEMDGYEAARRIREREKERSLPRTPILALTAHVLGGDREKCLQSGMDDYLSKPIDFAKLKRALEEFPQAGDRVIDPEHMRILDELQLEGKSDIIEEVIDLFIGAARDRMKAMRDALGRKDRERLAQVSHDFLSTCFTVGAKPLVEVCRNLEKDARDKTGFDRLAAMVTELGTLSARAETELKEILCKHKKS
jgi:signal transduction histidine kinase/CheY-like chemotaxis protein/HPt (histidine-containing phosphotransfer) domain-containing protein